MGDLREPPEFPELDGSYELFELRGRLQLVKTNSDSKSYLNEAGEFQEVAVFLEPIELLDTLLEKVDIYMFPKIQIHIVNLIDMLEIFCNNKSNLEIAQDSDWDGPYDDVDYPDRNEEAGDTY